MFCKPELAFGQFFFSSIEGSGSEFDFVIVDRG